MAKMAAAATTTTINGNFNYRNTVQAFKGYVTSFSSYYNKNNNSKNNMEYKLALELEF